MARRGWARSIAIAVVAGAGTGAAQLGLGYGLGIITWAPARDADNVPTADGAWSASLAWTVWVAATSVVVGAVIGNGFAAGVDSGRFVRAAWRVVMALASAIGALVTVPLVAIPARAAELGDNYAPHFVAGISAALGVVLGLIVALLALPARAIAANILVSALWLWVLAVIAVADGLYSGSDLSYGQLGVWKFTEGGPIWHSFYVPGALLMLGAAALIGGLAAFPGAGRADNRVGVAISGAFGPLIVAVGYVLAAPNPGQAPTEQVSAGLTAPYAVIAGLAGSVLVAVVGTVPSRVPAPLAMTPPRGAAAEIDPASASTGSAASGGMAKRAKAKMMGTANVAEPDIATGTAVVPASSRVTPSDLIAPRTPAEN